MTRKDIIIGIVVLTLLAALAGGTLLWLHMSGLHSESNHHLQEARDRLEDVRDSGQWAKNRDALAEVVDRALHSAELWEKNAPEAWTLCGEALLRMTKYREAIGWLEKALAARPGDAAAAALAGEAYHQLFLVARRDTDFGSAIYWYDRASDAGARPAVLLKAAQLAEAAEKTDLTDSYVKRLEEVAPESAVLERAKALQAARREGETGR